ncbi:MAG: solute carrier family 26 protein [Myxococcota bacterium]
MSGVLRYVPIVEWLGRYRRDDLRGDVAAGLTTAVILVPQGMAYAMLAGLPPIVGLYASVIPPLLYAVFGTSRQLSVGPVAMDSLMVASAVGAVAAQGSSQYIAMAIVLGAMVGIIQLLMGLLRLGVLVNLLSRPVVSGFTSAAALIIGFSQLKHLLGIDIARSRYIHRIAMEALVRIDETHGLTLILGLLAIGLLIGLKRRWPRVPGALIVVVMSTMACALLGLEARGVSVVGAVPAGFPMPSIPIIDTAMMRTLLPSAMVIALIGFVESVSVANTFAAKNRYAIDANQELIALGAANLGGAVFQGYPVAGGFSRSAVHAQAGARTPLALIVTAVVVAIALIYLTPLFYFLPKAALAAVILTAVIKLIDVTHVQYLWRVKRDDLALLVLTFVTTLTVGIGLGLTVGVGASLLWVLVKTVRPHVAVLGHLPGTTSYRNVRHYPEATPIPGVVILRMDAPFYFANVSFLKMQIASLRHRMAARVVILDCSGINELDSSAGEALHALLDDLRSRDVDLYLANVKGPMAKVLARSRFIGAIGADRVVLTVHHAVQQLRADGRIEGPSVDLHVPSPYPNSRVSFDPRAQLSP